MMSVKTVSASRASRASPWDELASILPVHEKIAAYYREVGVTFNGGSLVSDNSNPSV